MPNHCHLFSLLTFRLRQVAGAKPGLYNLAEPDGKLKHIGSVTDVGRSVGGHVARRLKRLEWTTRYRPVQSFTLFGRLCPHDEKDFLYARAESFKGEAALLLAALGISAAGQSSRGRHAEVFQRAGFFLTHPLEARRGRRRSAAALKNRWPQWRHGIRRSSNRSGDGRHAELALVLDDIRGQWIGMPGAFGYGKPSIGGPRGREWRCAVARGTRSTPAD